MKAGILFTACFMVTATWCFGQRDQDRYLSLRDQADAQYSARDYQAAASNYSLALRSFHVSGRLNDTYNAACSWALAGNPDSAFVFLDLAVSNEAYSDYTHINEDSDLKTLHSDSRWNQLTDAVKKNEETEKNISKQMWRDDISQLQNLLEYWHIDLYHETPKAVFTSEFKKLLNHVDSLDNDGIVLEIERMVALAKDGHTSFYPSDQSLVGFQYFPIILSQFQEGLFAISVSDSMPEIAGLKLTAIENTSIEDVRKKLIPYIARDNDVEIAYTYPDFIQCSNLLHLTGITKSRSEARFIFEDHGKKIIKTMHAIAGSDFNRLKWTPARESLNKIAPSPNLTLLFSNPLTISKLINRPHYWCQVFDAKKIIFLQYLNCNDQVGQPTFKDYVKKEIFDFIDKNPDYKLVIDLRYNPGGDPLIAEPLIKGIRDRSVLFQKNRPVVLVGTRTFSAAATNACELKDLCHAILIGQVSRARPNSPSEGRNFQLIHSKCNISISTLMVNRYPKAGKDYFIPMDKIIPMKYSDYIHDIDKTFEEVYK